MQQTESVADRVKRDRLQMIHERNKKSMQSQDGISGQSMFSALPNA